MIFTIQSYKHTFIQESAFLNVKDQTRVKNRIISFLDLHGIKLPKDCEEKHWSKGFIERIRMLELTEPYNI